MASASQADSVLLTAVYSTTATNSSCLLFDCRTGMTIYHDDEAGDTHDDQQQQQQQQQQLDESSITTARPSSSSRTLTDYWDDFYNDSSKDNDTSSIEWIVPPNTVLLEELLSHIPLMLLQQQQHDKSADAACSCDILEIGCGTSTLARDFYQYLLATLPPDDDTSSSSNRSSRRCRISMTATDVSEPAIEQNRQRDAAALTNNNAAMHYKVWNVVSESAATVFDNPALFDVILDKGCFDTILFRTDKRHVAKVAALFLDHVWEAMAQTAAVYLVVTPRRKHLLLNSYQGFGVVERHLLAQNHGNAAAIYKADKNAQSYLYVCRKVSTYTPGVDAAFAIDSARNTASGPDQCPSCGLEETKFTCRGKDRRREWIGHCTHCKL